MVKPLFAGMLQGGPEGYIDCNDADMGFIGSSVSLRVLAQIIQCPLKEFCEMVRL